MASNAISPEMRIALESGVDWAATVCLLETVVSNCVALSASKTASFTSAAASQ